MVAFTINWKMWAEIIFGVSITLIWVTGFSVIISLPWLWSLVKAYRRPSNDGASAPGIINTLIFQGFSAVLAAAFLTTLVGMTAVMTHASLNYQSTRRLYFGSMVIIYFMVPLLLHRPLFSRRTWYHLFLILALCALPTWIHWPVDTTDSAYTTEIIGPTALALLNIAGWYKKLPPGFSRYVQRDILRISGSVLAGFGYVLLLHYIRKWTAIPFRAAPQNTRERLSLSGYVKRLLYVCMFGSVIETIIVLSFLSAKHFPFAIVGLIYPGFVLYVEWHGYGLLVIFALVLVMILGFIYRDHLLARIASYLVILGWFVAASYYAILIFGMLTWLMNSDGLF